MKVPLEQLDTDMQTLSIRTVVKWVCLFVEEAPPKKPVDSGKGGGLFGSDDEEDDLFFSTPSKPLSKTTPKATPISASKPMTTDQKAALRYVLSALGAWLGVWLNVSLPTKSCLFFQCCCFW